MSGLNAEAPPALSRAALPADTLHQARWLIGKRLVRVLADGGVMIGRIVETEAYPPGDAAGHAFIGPRKRNRALFLGRGHAYVYLAYGSCYCCNVTSGEAGTGCGVLLRALEPLAGIADMQRRRGTQRLTDLGRGPGRLAEALEIDLALDGVDLCVPGPLYLADGPPAGPIGSSVRIGISKETERPWRFYLRGSPHVSGLRRLSP